MTVDQKGVVMRKEDLRQKKPRKRALPSPGHGSVPERKRTASVWLRLQLSIRPRCRNAPPAIMGLLPQENNPVRPECTNKRVWARFDRWASIGRDYYPGLHTCSGIRVEGRVQLLRRGQ
jgi:hypothetical protein